jgi:dipeptidyl aminopeptidase/acylaminoacyl peptidase
VGTRTVRWAALGAVIAVAPAAADGGVRDHDITLDDYFTQAYVFDMAIAPDGSHVAYVEGRWEPEHDLRNLDLWVVSTATKRVRRLTFDHAADQSPAWSADGDWVYFLTKREREGEETPPYDGSKQVWRVSVDGGPIFPVTRVDGGVQQFALSRDGRRLYYVAGREHVERDAWKSLKEEFDDLTYGHGVVTLGVLWKLDLETWRSEKLVDEERVIGAMAVAPDERRIAMITTPTEELITNEGWSHVDVYDAETGDVTRLEDREWRERAPSPFGWIETPAWSPDGRQLAFRVSFDGYPGELFITEFGDAVRTTRLARPGEVSVAGPLVWWPGTDDLCFMGDDRARQRLHRVIGVRDGGAELATVVTPGDVVLSGFDISADGSTLAILKGGLTHPPDIFTARDIEGDGRRPIADRFERTTRLNPQVDTWKLPQIELVSWRSADGTQVEGILELPPDYRGDGPLPMVVSIHGGPTASSKYAFRYWMYGRTLFAAKGWAVFDPNYRGSTGYGDKFLTDLIENKNNLDVQDILAGVEMLVEKGIADPERLAVMGWSNGGYLTNCLITASDRFRAASSGAGVLDTVMQWEIEDTPGHVINFSGGLPWERADKMHATSPLYRLDEVVTPTVVHVGEHDERVPVQHSRALHRALHHYVGVPCELLVYPGEGHGLTKYSHRRAKMKWDHTWFEHHVLQSAADE